MPDVGVLNLTIKDNSEQAAKGLNQVADALFRVRRAVKDSLKLSGIAKEIEKISKVVNESVNNSTIQKLSEFGDSLARLKGIGDVRINIKISENMRNAAGDIENIKDGLGGINTGFQQVGQHAYEAKVRVNEFASSMKDLNGLMQNTSWGPGYEQFKDILNAYMRMQAMFALGAGENNGLTVGFNSWKQGAIEVEGTVGDATNTVNGYLEGTHALLTGIVEENNKVAESIDNVTKSIENQANVGPGVDQMRMEKNYGAFREAYMSGDDIWKQQVPEMYGFTPEAIEQGETYADALRITMEEVNRYVDDFIQKMNTPAGELLRDTIDQAMEANLAFKSAQESAAVLKNAPELQNVSNGMSQVSSATQTMDGALENTNQKTTVLTESLEDLDKELKAKKTDAEGATGAFQKFKEGISSVLKPISNLSKRLKNMIISRSLRYLIRTVAKGFSEGVNNVYEYSKAVGNDFAPAMTSAKALMEQFKNSVGAAAAPLIQALIPVFKQLASAAITALNYVNQLFSLLTGKNYWIRAIDGVDNYTDATKAASKATSDWIADFDELNVIPSMNAGSESGEQNKEYAEMFEDVYAFDSKIREIVDFIKDNMESIKAMAIAIGTAILAWKLSNAFADSLPTLSKLFGYIATGAVIAITLQADWILTNKYLDTGEIGWLFASALTTAVGSVAAWAIAKKLIGGNAGYYAAAITLAFSAVTDIIANVKKTNVSALNAKSIITNVKAALTMGAAVGVVLAGTTEMGLTGILMAAGGAGLVTFGVATALKAITSADRVTWDTTTKITQALLAAAPVGIGLAMLGFGMLGGIGAFATVFAVTLALECVTPKQYIKWGNIGLTSAQIRAFVKEKMFTVDPDLMVTITSDAIKKLQMNQKALETTLGTMIGTLHVINLGLATDEDYKTIKADITTMVSNISTWIDSAEELDKLVLKFTPQLVGSTEEEQNNWYLSNVSGWQEVKKFCEDIGKEIADNIVEGENGELKVKRPERVQALLNEMARISEIIAGSDVATEAQIDFDIKLKNLDKNSFTDAMKEYKNYKAQMESAANELITTAYANQKRLINALKLMIEIDPNNTELQRQLQESEAGLKEMESNWNTAVEKTMNEMTAPGKKILQEWINAQFDMGGIDVPWTDEQIVSFMRDGIDVLFDMVFEEGGIDTTQIDVMDLLEVGGWDLLTKDLKRRIIQCLDIFDPANMEWLAKANIPADDIVQFTDWSSLTEDAKNQLISSLTLAYGSRGINALKKQFPQIKASDIAHVIDWASFTTGRKLEFLTAIKNSFGSNEAIKAAKDAGIDIGALVREGMNSKDQAIKEQAEEWQSIINKGVNGPYTANVKTDQHNLNTVGANVKNTIEGQEPVVKTQATVAQSVLNNVVKTIESVFPWMQVKTYNTADDTNKTVKAIETWTPRMKVGTYNTAEDTKKTVEAIETWTPWMKVGTYNTAEDTKKTVAAIESWKPWMQVKTYNTADDTNKTVKAIETWTPWMKVATYNTREDVNKTVEAIETWVPTLRANVINTRENMEALMSAIETWHPTLTASVITEGDYTAMAEGGIVESGEIFMANENGKAEMIGRFGSHTAVANQEQMVEAMARGVQYANSEQNSLLRKQNEILLKILQKEGTLNFRANSAFGRVASQSIEMYQQAAGV